MVIGTTHNIWHLLLLKEANELDLIDKEWYRNHIKYILKNVYFEHFKKEPEHESEQKGDLKDATETSERNDG